jgi:hypothetical protein
MICTECNIKNCTGCSCKCHATLLHPEYAHIKSYDKLVEYQHYMNKHFPNYPIEQKNWHKMSQDRVSLEGLKQIPILKRKIIMGEASDIDHHIFVRLSILHSERSPSDKRSKEASMECSFAFHQGHLKLSNMPDLKALGYTENNPDYDELYSPLNNTWGMDLIQHCHAVSRAEDKE